MILVTGAAGFLGQAVCSALATAGRNHLGASRTPAPGLATVGSIDGATDWSATLKGVDSIIHLAARVHVMNDTAADPLMAFRATNVQGTLNLARQAARAGVRRLVFVSSIKVNGEETSPGQIYRADDLPDPRDPYGVSKREAEDGLRVVSRETGLEVAIVRPPLIYGPGVRANFATMMRLIARGVPLPLGAVTDNRRSLVSVDNLASLLLRCLDHPNAIGRTLLVSDGEDLSTADLLRRLGIALDRPARLLPVPVSLLHAAAVAVGKQNIARRLLGSLQIDASQTCAILGWSPPVSVDEGLKQAAASRADR